ncbi:hypothetical protein [Chroococcidiopsis sp.]|uniref:hypothetical protein n=1 Tax=Chroococcidiopsis sp. TaxID=3088168 RepID=UPI003F3FC917
MNEHEVVNLWRREFSSLVNLVEDSLFIELRTDDWNDISIDQIRHRLTDDEKLKLSKLSRFMDWGSIDNGYDFRREVQNALESNQ